MYLLLDDNTLMEFDRGIPSKRLTNVKVKAVIVTNSDDPYLSCTSEILRWCKVKDFVDNFESIGRSLREAKLEQ